MRSVLDVLVVLTLLAALARLAVLAMLATVAIHACQTSSNWKPDADLVKNVGDASAVSFRR